MVERDDVRLVPGIRPLGVALLMVVALVTVSASSTHAAPSPCRVRNVTQDTAGRSLIRMVEKADDDDRLEVTGTCPGAVIIAVDIVIEGVGEGATLTGRARTRVLRVRRGASVTLQALIVRRGLTHRQGGGILNRGRLIIRDSIIRGNRIVRLGGPPDRGGGIMNHGRLRLADTTVQDNAGFHGGGIANSAGRVTLTRSTVSGNTAAAQGGGIESYGTLTLTSSTVSGNTAGGGGGLYLGFGTVTLTDATISGNTTPWKGGGLFVGGAVTVTLTDSTVRGNTADFAGGGITNEATLTLSGSSVTRNAAPAGGGIENWGRVELADVVVDGNEATEEGGGGIWNRGALDLTRSSVTGNTAAKEGGGIWNFEGGPGPRGPIPPGTATLDADSSVTGNTPDDCVGTPAC